MIGLSTVAEAHPQLVAGPVSGRAPWRGGPAALHRPRGSVPLRARPRSPPRSSTARGRRTSWRLPTASPPSTARTASRPARGSGSTSSSPSRRATSSHSSRATGSRCRCRRCPWTAARPGTNPVRRHSTSKWSQGSRRPRRSPSTRGPISESARSTPTARWSTTTPAPVLTTSWGQCEGPGGISPGEQAAETALFQQATAQGQSVFAASGDSGSSDCYNPSANPPDTDPNLYVDDPADQPDVTGVGGTSLTDVSDPPVERVWNEGLGGGSGGGGVSMDFVAPSWQQIPQVQNSVHHLHLRTVRQPAVPPGARRRRIRRPEQRDAWSTSAEGGGPSVGRAPRHRCGPRSPR